MTAPHIDYDAAHDCYIVTCSCGQRIKIVNDGAATQMLRHVLRGCYACQRQTPQKGQES